MCACWPAIWEGVQETRDGLPPGATLPQRKSIENTRFSFSPFFSEDVEGTSMILLA